ncbi:hypothetical protein M8J77_009876 [Diaphorina citri]|nr:hypothetical protein M8J77_009876 [Diaphorina citri]
MLIANLQSSLQTSSATSSQPQQQQSIVAVIESPGLEDESCLVVSTQSPHSPGLDFQHSLALVFIIFVLISYFLDTFVFPSILCILMLISCVL